MTQLKMGTTVKGVTLKSNTEDKIIVQCSHWNAVGHSGHPGRPLDALLRFRC